MARISCVPDDGAMHTYEISYIDFDAPRTDFPYGRRVVVGSYEAKNGIEAILTALRARGVDESDIAEAKTHGSIKRVVLYGVTFTATKES